MNKYQKTATNNISLISLTILIIKQTIKFINPHKLSILYTAGVSSVDDELKAFHQE